MRLARALAEEGLPAAALPATSYARPISPMDLCGLWMAEYGVHGPEVVEVALAASADSHSRRHNGHSGHHGGHHLPNNGSVACAGVLHARKLTGDVHVPAGELSWLATLPRWVGATGGVAQGASVPAAMQVAEAGYRNAQMVDGSLTVADEASLVLSLSLDDSSAAAANAANAAGGAAAGGADGGDPPRRSTMTFSRAHPRQEWLVDPSARGALLPPPSASASATTTARVGWGPATRRRLGLPAAADGDGGAESKREVEEEAERRAALAGSTSPASLWARMLHDLETREEAGSARARFWEDVAVGLGEASEAARGRAP